MADWLYDVAVGGLDFTAEGFGGRKCRAFQSIEERLLDAALMLSTGAALVFFGRLLGKRPEAVDRRAARSSDLVRTGLLIAYALVNALELCYKLATRDLIFLFNGCHLLSYLHIYMLANLSSSRTLVGRLFEASMPMVWVSWAAFVFPATDSRTLPLQFHSYYLHHLLIAGTPLYFAAQFPELTRNVLDVGRVLKAHGMFTVYMCFAHFVSYLTMANINVTLCPDVIPASLKTSNYRILIALLSLGLSMFSWLAYCSFARVITAASRLLFEAGGSTNKET